MLSAARIKKLAAGVGFDLAGVAPCRPMPESAARFGAWLEGGNHGPLAYLERHADKRFDPARLLPGALTAVVCAVGYKNRASEGYPSHHRAKVASYALAADYHTTLKAMLHALLDALRRDRPGLRGRAFVDTAPLSEKSLAVRAGLGWIGRQSLVVTPSLGSYVVLGELLLAEEADACDAPFEGSRCGRCRNCVEACPTGAIRPDRTVDARRCIACQTIECDPDPSLPLDGWIFGCDRCQSCCPYNLKAPHHASAAFDEVFDPLPMTPGAWLSLDDEAFARRLGATPLARSSPARIRTILQRAP